MSRFEFDCFVCPARLETDDIQEVIAFGERHKACGEETSVTSPEHHEPGCNEGCTADSRLLLGSPTPPDERA